MTSGAFYSLVALALLAAACADPDEGPRFGNPTTITDPVASAPAPADEILPFPAGGPSPHSRPSERDPVPSELAIARLVAAGDGKSVRDLALRLLAFGSSGAAFGTLRETAVATVRDLHGRRKEDGSFGAGDEVTEVLATLALLEATGWPGRNGGFEAEVRRAEPRLLPEAGDGSEVLAVKALGLLHVRSADERRVGEARSRLRAIVEERWEAARRSGGTPLAALVLVRLLLDDAVREDAGMKAALDRLLEEGPPVTDGRIGDTIRLFLLDTLFWRAFWWNRGDRERGERWNEARRAAVLPLREGLISQELAVIAAGLAGDEVVCVYGGFLSTLAGRR